MIHYHGSPMSGNRIDSCRFFDGKHAMVSYAATQDLAVISEVCQTFCIDNGAFSIWSKGKGSIDENDYYSFIRKWMYHPSYDFCLIPDVIEGTLEDNLKSVLEVPDDIVRPVPVYHFHEDLDYLKWMVDNFDMIALGSSGEYSTPGSKEWWSRCDKVFKVVCNKIGQPKVRVHGLRMLNPKVFSRLPLYSADSTNAVRNCSNKSRFGMYTPAHYWQRADIIAKRIESYQCSPTYLGKKKPQ